MSSTALSSVADSGPRGGRRRGEWAADEESLAESLLGVGDPGPLEPSDPLAGAVEPAVPPQPRDGGALMGAPSGSDAMSVALATALGDAPGAVALLRGRDHRIAYANHAFRDGFRLSAAAPAQPRQAYKAQGAHARPPSRSLSSSSTTNSALAATMPVSSPPAPRHGEAFAAALPELAALGLLDALDHVYATGTVFTAPEVRLTDYGSARRPAVLRLTCSPVRDREDAPIDGVLVSSVDYTDQAAAVDRLRAGERRHRNAAVALQRSLLPQRLSQPDDLRIAGCYLPGSSEGPSDAQSGRSMGGRSAGRSGEPADLQVGGDWYDVIPLGAGRTALVIGDVMGRGVHAAAVMGQLRAAVRAYAAANLPPGELLLHLDRHASELEGVAYAEGSASAGTSDRGALATAVYAVYDPDEHVLTYACAGHPAPLLCRPDGTVCDLDAAGGPPLGTGEWTWQEACIAIPPGSYLALFTDGLIERRTADLDEQLQRLRGLLSAAALAPLSGTSAQALQAVAPGRPMPVGPVDLVHAELLAGMDLPVDHDDDVALVVVHVPRWQGPRADLFRAAAVDLVGGTEIAAHARAFSLGVLRSWHVGEDLCDAGVLAVSELVANAAIHGRPPVRLRLRRTDRRLIIDVVDGDDHLPRRRLADDTDEDGRGIGIVAALADSWGARQLSSGKSVWCEFSL
ncbi:MAG TPA: ATP-binding SpoIIE family protein phosphatase [Actinocrinis sp.]|jgi:anti-sigma regulatory factor (Ser/Thr protein kinase)